MWHSDAERPQMAGNLQYHIQCKAGDVNRYVLLPGDSERVDMIAQKWDERKFIAFHREYKTYSGEYQGVKLSACSTGIGGPSSAIAIEELAELGSDTFIRIGTCGAIREGISCGELIICSGAVRQDGTSSDYVDISYPAIAHHEVVLALIQACERLGIKYHVGISCTTASFHCGQSRKGFRGYVQSSFEYKIHDMQQAGVMNFEMEASTIFTLAGLYGFRAGAVLAVVADRNNNVLEYSGIDDTIRAANEAVKILASWDKLKHEKDKRFYYPEIAGGR